MQIFESARLKLTIYYLLIIIAITAFFSIVIYIGVSRQMERSWGKALKKYQQIKEYYPQLERKPPPFFIEDLKQAKKSLFVRLLFINGLITVSAGLTGYFLAGQTLDPIARSLKEQKRFIADASHELKTPLTALKTSIEVALRDKKLTLKKAKKNLQESLEELDSLQNLTNSLLTLTFYQTKKSKLVLNKIDLKSLLEKTAKKMMPMFDKKKVKLDLDLKKIFVDANKESLQKVVVIVLDNALKYTPKGGKVTISTKKKKKAVEIAIKDTGIGIDKKDLKCIFRRFYRADKSRSNNKSDGFGLGLSLAKQIIELHNGSIKVNSQLNQGTEFIINIPGSYEK